MPKVKEKRERALGVRLGLKGERCNSPKCAAVRKPYPPGMHGPVSKRRRALSEFGRQLAEKQKFKLTYGLNEKNLLRLFKQAEKETGSTTAKIMELLERRLDNVIFSLGFFSSRATSRQMIIHGHVTINGHRVRSPGYQVKIHDIIGFREDSKKLKWFNEMKDRIKKYEPAAWLSLDKEKVEGTIIKFPEEASPHLEINLLVESFSK